MFRRCEITILALLQFVVVLLNLCGTTLFMHSHIFGDDVVTHSHIFLGSPAEHSHTSAQVDLISRNANADFTLGESVEYEGYIGVEDNTLEAKPCFDVALCYIDHFSLRAPPCVA